MATFKFDRSFQIMILGLMHQSYDFLILAQSIIKPEYFADEILSWYFMKMRDYYLDYQMRASPDVLRNELLKACRARPRPKIQEADIQAYQDVFKALQLPVPDVDYIVKEVTTFCRHQAIKAAVLEAPALLQQEKFDEIEALVRGAVSTGANVMDLGCQYFVDWPERLRRRRELAQLQTMPTGITDLDKVIGGGIKPKQIGIWMAPTNRGKTIALMQCGKKAVTSGRKVIHYTLEMSADAIGERYDSSFSRIAMDELADEEALLATRLEKYGRMFGNTLLIKEYATKQVGVSIIRSHLMQCMGMGFEPDLILVDYLDLLTPPRHYHEKRDELTATAEELRGLAIEMERPVWSATQAQRAAISLETHTEEHVSEDIGKMNIADLVITINQTKEEVDTGVMRLFVAKNRNGAKYRTVEINTNLGIMCFFDPPGYAGPPPAAPATLKS